MFQGPNQKWKNSRSCFHGDSKGCWTMWKMYTEFLDFMD